MILFETPGKFKPRGNGRALALPLPTTLKALQPRDPGAGADDPAAGIFRGKPLKTTDSWTERSLSPRGRSATLF